MTQTGTLPPTETLPPPPTNGGSGTVAFGSVPLAAPVPTHEQAKLNELYDLALQIKQQDSIVEERKNDLKSERGKREQLVQKHLQLSLETTLPLRAEAPREPTMFDGPPPWSEKLNAQQFAAVKILINQVRRENRGEPLRMMRLGDEIRLFLRIKDKPAEQVWAFGKTGEQGDVSALPWSDKQLAKAEAIYSWEERARELPPQCIAVSEDIMRTAEDALGRQPEDEGSETPNGLLGTFEFNDVRYAPTDDGHHDVPGSQLCLPALSPKEFKQVGATVPDDAARNGPLFGIRKRDPDNGSKPFHFGPLTQGIYLVAPDVLEAYRASKTDHSASTGDKAPPAGHPGVELDGQTVVIAREVGLTFEELSEAECSKLLEGAEGKDAPKVKVVQLGVNIHAVVSQKPGADGATEFTLLPLFPRDEFAAAPQRTAAEAMTAGPDVGNRLAGVVVAVARDEYCIGTDEGMQIVEATPPEKPKRGKRKAK